MISMKDTCQIAEAVSDSYGDTSIEILTDVDCLFLQNSSSRYSSNREITESDAHVYLDIENLVLKDRGYRVEGLYLVINPFGAEDSWYRISKVVVGQRKLLENDVDNVHAYLRKVAKPEVNDGS